MDEEKQITTILPKRDIDASIDVDAIRQSSIDDIKTEQRANELRKRANALKRRKLRSQITEEQNIELKKNIDKARLEDGLIVVQQGAIGLTGTTRTDVVKMLSKLNINLNMQLTKTDTMNLLATLLTCNEKQLKALEGNPKVPIAIKIVIKRLIEDSKVGNMESIERLWDRIFGKVGMSLELPANSTENGIIPNTPVSRETYMVMREVYFGK